VSKSNHRTSTSHAHRPSATYFVPISCRHSELGRAVHELQFTNNSSYTTPISHMKTNVQYNSVSSVRFVWRERGWTHRTLAATGLYVVVTVAAVRLISFQHRRRTALPRRGRPAAERPSRSDVAAGTRRSRTAVHNINSVRVVRQVV